MLCYDINVTHANRFTFYIKVFHVHFYPSFKNNILPKSSNFSSSPTFKDCAEITMNESSLRALLGNDL